VTKKGLFKVDSTKPRDFSVGTAVGAAACGAAQAEIRTAAKISRVNIVVMCFIFYLLYMNRLNLLSEVQTGSSRHFLFLSFLALLR
jgi:hypothetical protein